MATPATLDEWRDFVSRDPKEPEHLTARQLSSLQSRAREEYDERRLAWLSADIVLETRHVQAVRRMWAVLRSEALFSSNMAAKTLSISGSPTLGKTTLATWIARDHERRERARYPTLGTDEFQPSVYVVTPPATTPKMLMIAFSNFLGIPHARAITAQDLSHRVVLVLKSLRTSLVVLDEVHNVQSNRQLGAEAASTLKLSTTGED